MTYKNISLDIYFKTPVGVFFLLLLMNSYFLNIGFCIFYACHRFVNTNNEIKKSFKLSRQLLSSNKNYLAIY